ncbi:sulfite exporter TauE/SafE family protein [Leekyejoonella antrihumi]|uniref:Probable membrane transporter protein n=2 Tax=Leekyejoonella antrihumi TaxID=1660198 RepID=A0A563E0E5_9MICO|nr:sulfite exporter TauE/SafE family protein [Leekyejoonella antrihumi]
MGGGALMTPALIFLGIPPTAAVANDLVAAAVSKSVGAAVHLRHGSPNRQLVKWLVIGSVPMALVGSWIVKEVGAPADRQVFLKVAIGCTLLMTAATYVVRMYLGLVRTVRHNIHVRELVIRPIPTIAVGAVGGLLVGVTSVGSGSVIMVSLLLLYPSMSAHRMVGTDLLQAVPLVVAAAIGHIFVTGIEWSVLIPLVIGGSLGTALGARLSSLVSQSVIRRGIVTVLSLTGLGMIGASPTWVGITGAALIILGPVAWGLVRRAHGVPAFDHFGPPPSAGVRDVDRDDQLPPAL